MKPTIKPATAKTATVNVWWVGDLTTAYARREMRWDPETQDCRERIVIRVYDDCAGHYVEPETLTAGQRRRVIRCTLDA